METVKLSRGDGLQVPTAFAGSGDFETLVKIELDNVDRLIVFGPVEDAALTGLKATHQAIVNGTDRLLMVDHDFAIVSSSLLPFTSWRSGGTYPHLTPAGEAFALTIVTQGMKAITFSAKAAAPGSLAWEFGAG